MKCIKEALPRTQKPVHDSVSLQLGWHQEWPAQGRRTSTTTWRKSDVRVTAKMLRGAWNISFRRLFICANLSKTRGQFVSLKMTETIVYTKGKVTLCEMKQHSCFLLSKNWRITLGENRCFGLPLVRHKVPHERNVLSYVISKMQLWKATFSQLKWALCQMGKYALAMAIYCACWSSLLLAWAHQGQVGASTYTYQAAKCAKCISPIASQIVHSTDVMWLQLNTAAPLFSPSTSPSNLIVRSFHIDTPLFQNTQHPQSLWPSSTQLPSAPPATSWRCQWSLEARHLAPHTSTMPGPVACTGFPFDTRAQPASWLHLWNDPPELLASSLWHHWHHFAMVWHHWYACKMFHFGRVHVQCKVSLSFFRGVFANKCNIGAVSGPSK